MFATAGHPAPKRRISSFLSSEKLHEIGRQAAGGVVAGAAGAEIDALSVSPEAALIHCNEPGTWDTVPNQSAAKGGAGGVLGGVDWL